MSSSITFIPGRTTGSRNVIHDGYRYCLDKNRDDKTYWRCTEKTCSGRLSLTNNTTVTWTQLKATLPSEMDSFAA
jgi:hypothetical protein